MDIRQNTLLLAYGPHLVAVAQSNRLTVMLVVLLKQIGRGVMKQPIHGFDWKKESGEAGFGFVSGRTEKEAITRLKRRYQLTRSELATVAKRAS